MTNRYPPGPTDITGVADGCFQVVRAIVVGIAIIVAFFFIIGAGQGGRSGSVNNPGVYPYSRSREIEDAIRQQRAREAIRAHMGPARGKGS